MAKQKSVFKMALPFVVGVTVLLLVLITVIGVIATTEKKTNNSKKQSSMSNVPLMWLITF
ncbi:MAG: hypothetical protein IPG70_00205 [Moraxellaceae bacterium]|nr:hypothetical protein [Moraxellaceae bacterium]